MSKIPPVVAFVFMVAHGSAAAYEVTTHYDLSEEAVFKSALAEPDGAIFEALGLGADLQQQFPSSDDDASHLATDGCKHNVPLSVLRLFACGGQFEDLPLTELRSKHHFYDPIYERPLTILGQAIGHTSPDWVLEDNGTISGQLYSYTDARDYFYGALTFNGGANARESHAERQRLWGKVFQTLGQVIHHIQDMAQPDHVRNDQHILGLDSSLYEEHTSNHRTELRPILAGPGSQAIPIGIDTPFRVPRDFWENQIGSGLAEFTNRNFLSKDTNWEIRNNQQVATTEYAQPEWIGIFDDVAVTDLVPAVSPEVLDYCQSRAATCKMTFFSSVHDVENPRASTRSIFDQYVALREVQYEDDTFTLVDRIVTLNRYNFDTGYPLLLPRAVAHSAGLINYFFRGRLEIGLPAEGVYAVVDHNAPEGYTKGTGGFEKIKVSVRNVTPGGNDAGGPLIEAMATPGTLRAVVKYHLNDCYQPDLSGEYGSPGFGWQQCRSLDEYIAVSNPVAVPDQINASGSDVTFTFASRVPINASDINLQVVYRGPLGDEADAVVVATRDVSEPTYIYSLPRPIDQARHAFFPSVDPGPYTWEQWCSQGGMTLEQCDDDFGLRWKWRFTPFGPYDPAASPSTAGQNQPIAQEAQFAPVLESPAYVARFGRVAVLTDLEQAPGDPYPTFLAINLFETGISEPETFQWNWGRVRPVVAQFDPATQSLTPSHQYRPARGAYLYEAAAQTYVAGDDETVRPLQPVLTTITIPD